MDIDPRRTNIGLTLREMAIRDSHFVKSCDQSANMQILICTQDGFSYATASHWSTNYFTRLSAVLNETPVALRKIVRGRVVSGDFSAIKFS